MRTIHQNFRKSAVALALSIAATLSLVNGQAQSLTSVNQDNSSDKTALKDSVKEAQAGIAQLISAVLKKGVKENTGSNLAPVIGLPKAMPVKTIEIAVSQRDKVTEARRCFVVYEKIGNTAPTTGDERAVCAYIVKVKRSGLDKETRYFRFDLNGKLEKVVLSQGKYDEVGKVVRGSGVKFDQDINSPEVKKAFEAEMKFWLNDWLKKEQKNAAQ